MAVKYRLVMSDARSMRRVADDTVHLVVTSPPYWQLKDYEVEGQIGFHQYYENYISHLNQVWKECVRVIHPGCRAAINIGDQFARAETYGRYRVIPIHSEVIRAFEALELDFMGSIIWQKVTTCNTSGGGVVMGSFPYPRNGVVKLDYEHILIFKKPGKAPKPEPELKKDAQLSTEEWNEYFYGHWYFPGTRQKDHLATFPDELPRRLIRMFTFPEETVLDPFLGSGTTMKVARDLRRSCIGYEIQSDFEAMIKEKSGFGRQRDLLDPKDSLEVIHDESIDPSDADAPARRGTHRNGAVEGYGSVIRDGDSRDREDYYRVARVVNTCTVELDDGRRLGLLGLTENQISPRDGVDYLRGLVKGARVYFRTDPEAMCEDRVYLYLKNRTCLNSRLVRAGMADVDTSQIFRLKKRYLRYQEERGREKRG